MLSVSEASQWGDPTRFFASLRMTGKRDRFAHAQITTCGRVLEPIREKHKVPALAAAYVQGKKTVALGVVGVRKADAKEQVQPNDQFHLGSCTKSMTATLIARLVEQGKLSWEITLIEIFRDLRDKILPDYHKVTLFQLLPHRSGLPEDRHPDPTLFPKILALKGPLPQQGQEFAQLVLSQKPASEPGTQMAYSNGGYVIAGAIAEQITGQSWEDLMKKMLFEPLGMKTAGFGAPGIGKGDQPWGHVGSDGECKPVGPGPFADNLPVIGPAGRVHCSLSDWAKYASLHLRGAQGEKGLLLKPESFQKLHTAPHKQGYALGWIVGKRDWAGGKVLTHAGSNTMWFAVIWIAPARNAAFLAATNCGKKDAFNACDEAVAALIEKYLVGNG